MQLMLDTGREGAGETRGFERAESADRAGDHWSFGVRLGLVLAAIWTAWFIMTADWPHEIAVKAFSTVESGSLPAPLGTVLASLR